MGAGYAQLDPLTITLPHPDAAIAIISKSTELAGHYGVAVPGLRTGRAGHARGAEVLTRSAGRRTNGVVFMAKKFRDADLEG